MINRTQPNAKHPDGAVARGRRRGPNGGLASSMPILALVGVLLVAGGGTALYAKDAKEKGDRIWKELKDGSGDLLIVFAVDKSGAVQPYYGPGGKPAPFQLPAQPLANVTIDVTIGNPKVRWTNTNGDRECVVY